MTTETSDSANDTLFAAVLLNASTPILEREAGRLISPSAVQPKNAISPIVVSESQSSKSISLSAVQPLNAFEPMLWSPAGSFTVVDIKRATYSELFPSDEESADRWFKCKLFFITLDEKSGAEKKTSTQVLVQAADLRDAVKKLDEAMKGTMADYQIAAVAETPIMDVYPYSEDEAGDEHRQPKEPTANELLSACREGERTEVIVGGRKIIVDKRGKNTVVIPSDEENQKPNP